MRPPLHGLPRQFGILPSAWLDELSRPGSILLDTARLDQRNYRSFLFTDPLAIIQAQEDVFGAFSEVERYLAAGRWVAGYVAYEAGSALEPALPRRNPDEMPRVWFCVYKAPRVFDHRFDDHRTPDAPEAANAPAAPGRGSVSISGRRLGIAREEYCRRVNQIRSWIAEGDVYQVNFTSRVGFEFSGSPVDLYRRLRHAQHVSYSAFLHAGEMQVLSFSPELFFRVEGQRIVTRPMKGTAGRGRWMEEDDAEAERLPADEKNRAENVMIVDLLRNDLGRICEYGSVRVEELCAVERYDTVLQMTSTVSGRLPRGTRPEAIFRALFPSGSVTGAPKIRAMQHIHELEPVPRGVYCGAIGFFDPAGNAEFSVPIRTIVLDGHRGEMGVGSGIVHDSDADSEFRECELKAKFLEEDRGEFDLIESLLWEKGFPLLPLHLERLGRSCRYFGFALDPERVEAELLAHAGRFAAGEKHKVRVLVNRYGGVTVQSAVIGPDRPTPRVVLAAERVCSRDPFLFHKTTRRARHEAAYADSRRRGADEALLLNERGDLTEGTRHNVFVEIGGELLTPPVACGLLPGVYREHLLRNDPRCREHTLKWSDVQGANAIYICNAVRGMRRALLLTQDG